MQVLRDIRGFTGAMVRILWSEEDVQLRSHVHQWISTPTAVIRAPASGRFVDVDVAWGDSIHVHDAVYESCPLSSWRITPATPRVLTGIPFPGTNRTATAQVNATAARGKEDAEAAWRWAGRIATVAWWCVGCQPPMPLVQPLAMSIYGLLAYALKDELVAVAVAAAGAWIVVNCGLPLALEIKRRRIRFPNKERITQLRSTLVWNACNILTALVIEYVILTN
jgi:hypothetical protein